MSIITKTLVLSASLALASFQLAHAADSDGDAVKDTPKIPSSFNLGTDINDDDLSGFFSSAPDGSGLPEGSGTAEIGKKVYQSQCLACHGAKLEGGIGDRLVGGRGSLANEAGDDGPVKTVESYWPYATTIFDYVKRSMPFDNPGSLSNDDVYAVTAYILSEADIISEDKEMNAESLADVEMPNRDGFTPADR